MGANIMNLLHLFDKTETKLREVKKKLNNPMAGNQIYFSDLKKEKEYLLDVLALLFKELER